MLRLKNTSKLDILNLKLKSVMKLKLSREKRVFKLRNIERSLCDELYTVGAEIELLTGQLEDLKDDISGIAYEMSNIEIHKAVEESTIKTRISGLIAHRKEFIGMFNRESKHAEFRNKELEEKEALERELDRQKQRQIDELNEQQGREASAVEKECEVIERECVVLKKRNNAIMLKLRRRLLETENARRELIKKNGNTTD